MLLTGLGKTHCTLKLCFSPGPCTAKPFFLSAVLSTDALFHGDCPLVPKYALPMDIFHRQSFFSVDLSCPAPYPQVFFQGRTKNQRLVKSSMYFSYKKKKQKTNHLMLELNYFSLPSVGANCGDWEALGTSWCLEVTGRARGARWQQCVAKAAPGWRCQVAKPAAGGCGDVAPHWAGVQPVPIPVGDSEVAPSCPAPGARLPLGLHLAVGWPLAHPPQGEQGTSRDVVVRERSRGGLVLLPELNCNKGNLSPTSSLSALPFSPSPLLCVKIQRHF